jgi:tetratricopeptide (TPR) repeat protein
MFPLVRSTDPFRDSYIHPLTLLYLVTKQSPGSVVKWRQEELEKAQETLPLALQDDSTVLTDDQGLILEDAFNNVVIILSALGYTEDAQANYGLALKGYEEKLGIHHRLTSSTISNVGVLFAELKQWEASLFMFYGALRERRNTLGREHASTLDTMNNMGICVMNLSLMKESKKLSESKSQRENAKTVLEEVRRRYEKTLGSKLESTVCAERNLGCLQYL